MSLITVSAFLADRAAKTAVKPLTHEDLDKFTANLRKPVFVEDKLQCAKSHVLQFAGALATFTAENSRHRTDGLATKIAQAVELSLAGRAPFYSPPSATTTIEGAAMCHKIMV